MSWADQVSHSHPDEFRWLPRLMRRECANPGCQNPAHTLCSYCHAIRYCSYHCENQHLPIHIWECPRVHHLGHYLLRACDQGIPPAHADTRGYYGFRDAGRKAHVLLRLYSDFVKGHPTITADELFRWTLQEIVGNIKGYYESLPLESRGDAYAWFLRNQWVLNRALPTPAAETFKSRCERILKTAWGRAGFEQDPKPSSWSKEDRECIWHYAVVVSGEHYLSFREIWDRLDCINVWTYAGYCTDKDDGRTVTQFYRKLFEKCPLNEYRTAYKTCAVYQLMEKYRVLTQVPIRTIPPHFQFVLHHGNLARIPSVWLLKQNLTYDSSRIPKGFVGMDYGFGVLKLWWFWFLPRKHFDQECDKSFALTAVYLAAFRTSGFDELELDSALRKGQSFDYVSKFVPILQDGEMISKMMRQKNPVPNLRVEGDLWYWIYYLSLLWGYIRWSLVALIRMLLFSAIPVLLWGYLPRWGLVALIWMAIAFRTA